MEDKKYGIGYLCPNEDGVRYILERLSHALWKEIPCVFMGIYDPVNPDSGIFDICGLNMVYATNKQHQARVFEHMLVLIFEPVNARNAPEPVLAAWLELAKKAAITIYIAAGDVAYADMHEFYKTHAYRVDSYHAGLDHARSLYDGILGTAPQSAVSGLPGHANRKENEGAVPGLS